MIKPNKRMLIKTTTLWHNKNKTVATPICSKKAAIQTHQQKTNQQNQSKLKASKIKRLLKTAQQKELVPICLGRGFQRISINPTKQFCP